MLVCFYFTVIKLLCVHENVCGLSLYVSLFLMMPHCPLVSFPVMSLCLSIWGNVTILNSLPTSLLVVNNNNDDDDNSNNNNSTMFFFFGGGGGLEAHCDVIYLWNKNPGTTSDIQRSQ